jgi:hypothetical protein
MQNRDGAEACPMVALACPRGSHHGMARWVEQGAPVRARNEHGQTLTGLPERTMRPESAGVDWRIAAVRPRKAAPPAAECVRDLPRAFSVTF